MGMVSRPKIVIGALNISADPHPKGIYRRLFQKNAERAMPLWGNDWAKITAPADRETAPPSFYGRVIVWTEIDKDGKWLDQKTDKEATPTEKQKIQIPENLDPNFRSFNFVFFEDRHLLVLEYQNELGEHFGSKRAQRFFGTLLNSGDPSDPEVTVTVIPSHEALDRIYAIPRLRRLEIFVERPNPDDLTPDANRILDRLLKQGAKSQTVQLDKKARVITLTPDKDTKKLAEIAATNGHVAGSGKAADGKPVYESTRDHPKTVIVEVAGPTSIGAFYAALRLFN
jgi:Domain of unknown function (DUF4747)